MNVQTALNLFIVLIFSCGWLAGASELEQVDYSAQAKTATHAYMSNPDYYKTVYIWKERKAAEKEAESIKEVWKKTDLINARVTSARFYVRSDSFNKSLEVAILSDLTSFIGKSRDWFFDMKNLTVQDKDLGTFQNTHVAGEDFFRALLDKKHPDHAQAVEDAKMIKYDPNIPFEYQEPIQKLLGNEALKEFMRGEFSTLRDWLASRPLSKEQQEALVKALMKASGNVAKDSAKKTQLLRERQERLAREGKLNRNTWDALSDKEKGAILKDAFEDEAKFFDTASGIASSFQNKEAATTLHKMATLERNLGGLADTLVNTSFGKSPMAYINGFSGSIGAIIALFTNDTQSDVLMTAIRQIADQISKLRELMERRFDDLDFNSRSYFDQEMRAIGQIQMSTSEAAASAKRLEEKLDALRSEMQRGFQSSLVAQDVQYVIPCLKPRLSKAAIETCTSYFGGMAVSAYGGKDGKVAINLDDLINLSKQLKAIDPSQTIFTDAHPSAWILYTTDLLKMFSLNPRHKDVFSQTIKNHAHWSLDYVIDAGKRIRNSFQNILVNNGRLKKETLLALLENYRLQAGAAIDNAFEIAHNGAMSGQHMFVDDSPLPRDPKYSFAKKPIDFCEGTPRTVSSPAYVALNGYYNFVDAVRFWDPNFFRGEQIIPLLTSKTLWTSLKGNDFKVQNSEDFGITEVIPCWRSVGFPRFDSTPRNVPVFTATVTPHVSLNMVLEIHIKARYREFNDQNELQDVNSDLLVEKFELNRDMVGYHTTGNYFEICPPLAVIWSNQGPCGPPPPGWSPIIQDVKAYFKRIDIPPSKELQAFYQHVNRISGTNKDSAQLKFNRSYSPDISIPELRALKLAVQIGLDPNQAEVKDFIDWLATDAGLADHFRLGFQGLRTIDPGFVKRQLNQRIQIAKEKIEAIDHASTLKARTDEIDNLLNQLEQLR